MYIHFVLKRSLLLIDYIKRLFKNPTEIYTARNMKNMHYFLFILFMSISMTLLSLFSIKPEFESLSNDYNEIKSFIPAFQLIEGELESDEDSYIYQTDNIVFYFDSQNKIDTELINKNMKIQNADLSIGLLNKEIYIGVLGNHQSFRYSDLNLTTDQLKANLNLETFYTPLIYAFILIILFFFNLFMYITQLFSISIFANLISAIQKSKLTFFQNAKISLLASMLPFLILSITNAFQIPIRYQYEIIATASLILFYLSLKEFKNRLKEKADVKK